MNTSPLKRFLDKSPQPSAEPKPKIAPKREKIPPPPPRQKISPEAFRDLQGRILDVIDDGGLLAKEILAAVGGHRKDVSNAIHVLELRQLIIVDNRIWKRIRRKYEKKTQATEVSAASQAA